jgi:hypothetical protein
VCLWQWLGPWSGEQGMSIDLRYVIPFVLPVVLMQFLFFMAWLSGLPLDVDYKSFALAVSTFFGIPFGFFFAFVTISENLLCKLVIRIGKENKA